jgi:hypothetical protein
MIFSPTKMFAASGKGQIAIPNKRASASAVLALCNALSAAAQAQDVSFIARTDLAAEGPTSVAVDDFNGDGVPDLAVANAFANNVSVRLGSGSST